MAVGPKEAYEDLRRAAETFKAEILQFKAVYNAQDAELDSWIEDIDFIMNDIYIFVNDESGD